MRRRRWARMGAAGTRRAVGASLAVCLVAGGLSLVATLAPRRVRTPPGAPHLPAARRRPTPAAPGSRGRQEPARTAERTTLAPRRLAGLLAARPPGPGSVGVIPSLARSTSEGTRRRPTRPRSAGATPTRAERRAALTLRQWCVRYLAYLGAPVRRADDPRLAFLERWATVEATFRLGNDHNPLDTEMPEPGAGLWNAVGVRRYPSLLEGFRATRATMELGSNRPILLALSRRSVTMAELALALAKSNWTGRGQTSWLEQGYASEISHRSPFSFGLPEPTVTLRGRVVGPFGRPRGDVCVAAVPRGASVHRVETSGNGRFELSGLPRTRYRLELSDCRGGRSTGPVWFYDARAEPNLRTRSPGQATTLGVACSAQAHCPDQRFRLHEPIELGRTVPPLSWRPPPAITYGTSLSRAELAARAGVKGTFSYRPPLGTRLSGGLHELHAVFEPANAGAFEEVSIDRLLRVRAASPRLTWVSPAPIPSTAPVSARELDATAAVPGRMGYSIPHGIRLPPGRHVLEVTFVPADPRDYAVARAAVSLTVVAPPTSRQAPTFPAGAVPSR